MLKENEKSLVNVQRAFDAIGSGLLWMLAYWIRFNFFEGAERGLLQEFLILSPLTAIFTVYFFQRVGLYRSHRYSSRYLELLSVARGSFLSVTALVVVIYFVSPERISRLTILFFFILLTFGLSIFRLIIRNFLRSLRKKGKNLRNVLLVGNSKLLIDYIHTAKFFKDSGIVFTGWFESEGKAREFGISEHQLSEFEEIKNKVDIDRVIVAYEGNEASKTSAFVQDHFNDVVNIQILPDLSYSLIGHHIEDFGGIPVVSMNTFEANLIELGLKRSLDIIGSLIGLILLSPLFLLLGVLIKLSSRGPVFYGQERVGIDGRNFQMWKFRSMKVATDTEDQTEWSNKDNPRKTKVGDFMRRTSLDELPQLWNVLWGEMSLIGPRPERPHFVKQFRHEIPGYMLRHKMRAGISGWAQVNGWRGDTSLVKRIECDIYYIKNWSLIFDIKILFLTFFKGFINKNAY